MAKEWTIEDYEAASKLVKKFIQTVENDLGEDEHKIEGNPMSAEEFQHLKNWQEN